MDGEPCVERGTGWSRIDGTKDGRKLTSLSFPQKWVVLPFPGVQVVRIAKRLTAPLMDVYQMQTRDRITCEISSTVWDSTIRKLLLSRVLMPSEDAIRIEVDLMDLGSIRLLPCEFIYEIFNLGDLKGD